MSWGRGHTPDGANGFTKPDKAGDRAAVEKVVRESMTGGRTMNDVKIIEDADTGALFVGHKVMLYAHEVAALREHFVAEHDAALVAERDAGRGREKVLTGWLEEAVAERDAAREQLRAAEAVFAAIREHYPPLNAELSMRGGNGPFVDKGMEGYIEAFSVVDSILSGYESQGEPVSSAHTEHDAEVWVEGWQQGFRDYQARQYDSEGHAVITPTPNPYRVTPSTELNHTEEPPCC